MKKTGVVLPLLLSLLLLFAPSVFSEGITPGSFSLTPFIGGYFFDDDDDAEDAFTGGLGFGYNYNRNLATELGVHYVSTDGEGSSEGDVSALIYHIDALYHFLPDQKLVPYLAAGLGGISYERDHGSDDTDALVNWGGGLKFFLNDDIALRADLRHVIPFDDARNNFMANAGLAFFFGGKPGPAAPAAPRDSDGDGVADASDQCPGTPAGVRVDAKGCPLDSDGDGVLDHLDKCANTPRGTTVDKSGCPIDSDRDGVFDDQDRCPNTPSGARVDAKGCPMDSDGDGVLDDADRCPDTPRGVKVDATGCPLDTDKDGVFDHLDKCPGTPAGAKVDEVGCTIKIEKPVRIELKVLFDTDKSEVKDEYRDELKKVADFMTSYPDTKAVIEGHTDDRGGDDYNRNLSQNRADAVMHYLIHNFGVPANRLSAMGYGESSPVASNDTEEGRTQNRRVIAEISGTSVE